MTEEGKIICDAALKGDIIKVKAILKIEPQLINVRIGDGLTPLHSAVFYGNNVDLIEFLILNGADINSKDILGLTPLHWSSSRGNKKVSEFLLFKKADINARERNGCTPLHMTAYNGHRDVVELLISKGADINTKANDGYTPLHMASCNGFLNVVRFLVLKGADINVRTNSGATPVDIASNNNKLNVVEFLRKSGGMDAKELEIEKKKETATELKTKDMRKHLIRLYYDNK